MANVRRIYLWFKGAPEDRPGGPWWYHDFERTSDGYEEMLSFIQAMRPFAYAMIQVDNPAIGQHDPMTIFPCAGERVQEIVAPR